MSLRFLYNHTSNRIYTVMEFYALVKSQETPLFVIPAKAGIQGFQEVLDPGDPVPAKAGSRGDGFGDFLRGRQF
jgi:hypothetical protein